MDRVRILSIVFMLLAGCIVAQGGAAAPPEGKGKSEKHDATDGLLQPNLNYDDIRRIAVEQHYTGHKALPPGIAKKSPRVEFVRQLPTYPDYEWKRCGTDLVLVQIATQVVAEVLANIFQ